MTQQELILENHPFLRDLSQQHIDLIARQATPQSFEAGRLIFRHGEPAAQFYLITEGRVALEVFSPGRGPVPVMTLETGDVLGWSWLLEPFVWNVDARAVEPTRVISLHGAALREECEAHCELGYQLLKRLVEVIAQRLMTARIQLLDLYSVYREGGKL
jgi:CRP-like cAMP-binding protein